MTGIRWLDDDDRPPLTPALIEEARRMTPTQKLARVCELNRELEQRHRARILAQYGEMPEEEMRLRLGSLRLGRETMVKVFGWDPDEMGW